MDTTDKHHNDLFTDHQRVPVFRVELVRERSFDTPITTCPADVAPVVCDYLKRADREHFVVVMLATNNRIIGINTAHVGSLDASVVSVREVMKPLFLCNAAKAIVCHNHPSGNLEPSRADIRVTRRLVEAGTLLEIPVIDSLIIGHEGRFVSLAERGLMN